MKAQFDSDYSGEDGASPFFLPLGMAYVFYYHSSRELWDKDTAN